ncbi:pyridoxamine 5'-phosphate oxidase family protein [Deinococcus cellulosilyticus]|uniref:Pyridoxamine 5'-phosphate oxidase n=1 Tax=Deinococcus cellulosilyticus (strain DSM 18568 / NBRC 106333 / KACC 11606 / 5516J-15) TaxID=1223518 RepID=A0A511NBC1_DEIC1|nr:pyridoxamine 5'-phosphate oxidase family protein [Deinococcus cellulosilyticus]GEM49856.1 pyridoxamine 5'-phosphate oxidase [Deinococcus cellulosilyticus NBRC 106333 = KACC 11606]
MGKKLDSITGTLQDFIEKQKIFFVGTAGAEGHVNLSPKGMDSLRVLGPNRVAWLNVTGSGNESAAHVLENGRMTVMFCAFEGPPMILRLYGKARVYHAYDPEWPELLALFPTFPGTRQIFVVDVDLVQTSCGMAVPFFDYRDEREELNRWAEKKSPEQMHAYWEQKNTLSLDGKPTHIFEP